MSDEGYGLYSARIKDETIKAGEALDEALCSLIDGQCKADNDTYQYCYEEEWSKQTFAEMNRWLMTELVSKD